MADERRSSPDSDPVELKRQLRRRDRQEFEDLVEEFEDFKADISKQVAGLTLDVAKLGASLKAWGAAMGIALVAVQILLKVIGK